MYLKNRFSFHKMLALVGGDTKPFGIVIICGDTAAFVVVLSDVVAFTGGFSQRRMGNRYHGYHVK